MKVLKNVKLKSLNNKKKHRPEPILSPESFMIRLRDSKKPPLIVAEIGWNHNHDLNFVSSMIRECAKSGADAVKFQLFSAETLAHPSHPDWKFYKQWDFIKPEHMIRFAREANQEGLTFLCTPLSTEHAVFLNEEVDMPAFKIASLDIDFQPLLDVVSKFGKPMLISTGAATWEEIKNAVLFSERRAPAIPLHCVSEYPTPPEHARLSDIQKLRLEFPGRIVGYSDHHVFSPLPWIIATTFGARILEKHFTLDKNLAGPDHLHSMDPEDLRHGANVLHEMNPMLGEHMERPSEMEWKTRISARRSVFANENIRKNAVVKRENLICLRPSGTLSASKMEEIVGKRAQRTIQKGKAVSFKDFH